MSHFSVAILAQVMSLDVPDIHIDGLSIKAVFQLVNSGGLRLDTLLQESRAATLTVASLFVSFRNGEDWRLCTDADRENHLCEELYRERAGHYDASSSSNSSEVEDKQEDAGEDLNGCLRNAGHGSGS